LYFLSTGHGSLWACCAAPPPPKPKKEKKVKKEKEKKDKKEKEKKEKKSKKSKKSDKETGDECHSLPVGFQCNGSDEVTPVTMRDPGDDTDQCLPQGKVGRHR